jgi:hypothetical protein
MLPIPNGVQIFIAIVNGCLAFAFLFEVTVPRQDAFRYLFANMGAPLLAEPKGCASRRGNGVIRTCSRHIPSEREAPDVSGFPAPP